MKDARLFLFLVVSVLVVGSFAQSIPETTHPPISALQIDPQSVTVLRLRPGYASSVRLPEEVSSVMIGNPASFKAEHSEAEPRLVFIKPTTSQPAQSNALITTKSGQEVSLHLVSTGRAAGGQAVDFLLEYTRPRSLLVEPSAASSFLIADVGGGDREKSTSIAEAKNSADPVADALARQARLASPEWHGKALRTAIGEVSKQADQMIVPFSVLNATERWIELLPPQIQLSGNAASGKAIKAEPVPVTDYEMDKRRLGPGARADGVVVFARPTFKESNERLMLQLAQADQVDHPILLPLPFVAGGQGGKQQ